MMLGYAFWVVVSFFAVIGILLCLIGSIEFFALRRMHSIKRLVLRAELRGEEPQMEYLINSLVLLTDRFCPGGKEIELEVKDCGLSEESGRKLRDYCEKNPWVVFTEE